MYTRCIDSIQENAYDTTVQLQEHENLIQDKLEDLQILYNQCMASETQCKNDQSSLQNQFTDQTNKIYELNANINDLKQIKNNLETQYQESLAELNVCNKNTPKLEDLIQTCEVQKEQLALESQTSQRLALEQLNTKYQKIIDELQSKLNEPTPALIAPPPPGPPPSRSRGSSAPDFLSEIRGARKLKKSPPPRVSSRAPDLMSQIRGGHTLRKSPTRARAVSTEKSNLEKELDKIRGYTQFEEEEDDDDWF
jgi:hypothetical protein